MQPAPPATIGQPEIARRWSLPKRIGFRFLFAYFVLFFLTGQEIVHLPFSGSLIARYTELWLVLDGQLEGRRAHVKLRKLKLTGKNFHWIIDPSTE